MRKAGLPWRRVAQFGFGAILLCAAVRCVQYDLRPPPDLTGPPVDQSLKIAFVGFRPFGNFLNRGKDRIEQRLNYLVSLSDLLEFGNILDDVPTTGLNARVSEFRIQAFRAAFLRILGPSGEDELNKLFTYSSGPAGKRWYLRARDVDYYIVGLHLPRRESATLRGCATSGLTILPFLFTFGVFPFMEEFRTRSTFLVLDANLKHLKTFEYTGIYRKRTSITVRTGYRGTPGGAPPPAVFQSEIAQFRNDFRRFIATRPRE